MGPSISFITIGVRDLPAMRAFYQRWGWVEKGGASDTFVAFDAGGVRLAFYRLDLLGDEAAPGEVDPASAWNGFTLALNTASRAEVDDEIRRAVDAGARLIAGPTERAWGGRSGYVADPEGTRWEIAWAPEPEPPPGVPPAREPGSLAGKIWIADGFDATPDEVIDSFTGERPSA